MIEVAAEAGGAALDDRVGLGGRKIGERAPLEEMEQDDRRLPRQREQVPVVDLDAELQPQRRAHVVAGQHRAPASRVTVSQCCPVSLSARCR